MSADKMIQNRLFEMQDLEYQVFQSRLIPTVERGRIIGIRVPQLRSFAKELGETKEAAEFMERLPHDYYDEDNLHACLIAQIREFDTVIEKLNDFLPYIDNWATCDMLRPGIFKKHLPELLVHIKKWVRSDHLYTVRFGLEMLMLFYLEDQFEPEYLDLAADVNREEYYVRMMVAWFFATALAKQYEFALPYLEGNRLSVWVHNKTIQKATESYRITEEQKNYLKKLKR